VDTIGGKISIVKMAKSMKTLLEPSMGVQVPLFDGANYVDWREGMKKHLKSRRPNVWDFVASKKWYMKNKSKPSKDDHIRNTIALQALKKE